MVAVPENTVTQEDLTKWYELQQQLAAVKASEMLLRTKIYKGLFVEPKEGTNSIPLSAGWVLKAKRTIQRDIDLAAFQALATMDQETQKSKFSEAGIVPEIMIKWKPELVTKSYRALTPEQLAIFDQCLIIKDGSPALEIVLPAAAAKAAAAAAQLVEQDPANLC